MSQYSGDTDDKQWLYEHNLLPITGGKVCVQGLLVCESIYLAFLKVQLNPGNLNCHGKLKLLRVIGVSNYGGFERKNQKHLIKRGFVLLHV